jgi:hypothetical protein
MTQPVSINLPKTWVAWLRREAHKQSLETDTEIIYTDLIRIAVKEKYPEILKIKEDGENEKKS